MIPEQQDRVLSGVEKPEVEAVAGSEQATTGFAPSTPAAMQQYETETELDFFQLLVLHTRQGFYADPIYGGNQHHVGWQLIGFPGPSSMAETFAGHPEGWPDALTAMLRTVYADIGKPAQARQPWYATFADGARALAVVSAATQSEGRWIDVPSASAEGEA